MIIIRIIKLLIIFLLLTILFVNCNKINEIEINSNPSNAKLYIDSKYFGETPIKLTLNNGEHFIELEKEGFKVLKEKIIVSIFSRKKYLYNLEKISIIYSKRVDVNNIDLIKAYNDYIYLAADNLIIYKLNLSSGEIIEKKNLKEINLNELNCSEDENDKKLIKFDINKFYTPKDIINLFLNIKTYLLKSNCQKVFEKRIKDVKDILNLIIIDKELTEKILNSLKESFLEMEWINNETTLPVEFKIYIKFYGEHYKNDLSCFYIQNLYLKKLEIKQKTIPFNDIPFEWSDIGKYISGIWTTAINFYDTFTLRKIDNRWYIIEIKNSETDIENLPKETSSFFLSSSYNIFPYPPKIKDVLPLPEDIKNDIDKSKTNIQFKDKIKDINFFENNIFITTYLYQYIFDSNLNFIDKNLSYLPLNSSYGLRITFTDNIIKITYFDFKNKISLWEKDFLSNFIFFLNEIGKDLIFLEFNNNSIYLIKINSENGSLNFKKEILKINLLEQEISYPFFKVLKNGFLFFNNYKVFLFDFNGEILWEKDFKERIYLLNSFENIMVIIHDKIISIYDLLNGKLLNEIKFDGDIQKIYLSKKFIFYIEKLDNKNFLTNFDLNKNEKTFILQIYDENIEIFEDKILIYKLNNNTINLVDIKN